MESLEESIFKKSKRVVLKIGSAIIIGNNSNLINEKLLRGIVNEINKLHKMEKEVLLVSSGALALGKKNLKLINNLKLTEKQAAASIGQVLLINAWLYERRCLFLYIKGSLNGRTPLFLSL